jgi:short-subunit dehydrogenase
MPLEAPLTTASGLALLSVVSMPATFPVARAAHAWLATWRRPGSALGMDTERPLALVTGASAGIGRAIAQELAARGFDLVVAADDAAIHDAAQRLRASGATVAALRLDLADAESVERLWGAVMDEGRPLAAAVLNAGIGTGGAFAEDIDLEDDLRVVDLNVRSTVQLAKHVAHDMALRGEGRMLFTSSIAVGLPGTYQATYNASKAFVESFALALRHELHDKGVSVTVLLPGPTDTTFFARNAMDDTRIATGPKDAPEDVARAGVESMLSGAERVVASSWLTKMQHLGMRLLPAGVKAEIGRVMARPGSGRGDRRGSWR